MELESKIRKDLWKAIQAHYERKDFTEAVRDMLFHICELIREKSGVADKDGSKLIDDTLLGKNPLLLINKNETSTEKNIQQGIGFALKGMMQAIRDPISHEKVVLSEDDADSLILYSNYLLNQIDKFQSPTRISDFKDLIYDSDFTSTEEYSKCLIKEIPVKKRYDLLVDLYNDRENLPQNTLTFFIGELISSLSKASIDSFIGIVSNSLIHCKDNKALIVYLHYFFDKTFKNINQLAKLRIEDLLFKSIKDGKIIDILNNRGIFISRGCNDKGILATWMQGRLNQLGAYEQLMNILYSKIEKEGDEAEYVFTYFSQDIIRDDYNYNPNEVRIIKKQLLKGDVNIYYLLTSSLNWQHDEMLNLLFGDELKKCRLIIEDDIPF